MASSIEEEHAAARLPAWTLLDYQPNSGRWHTVLSRLLGLPTDQEVAIRSIAERRAEAVLPETVAPDDPARLALEAEMRALGYRPRTLYNFPIRQPLPRPGWRDRVRTLLGG